MQLERKWSYVVFKEMEKLAELSMRNKGDEISE